MFLHFKETTLLCLFPQPDFAFIYIPHNILSFLMLPFLLRLAPEYTCTLNTFTYTTFLSCSWWMSLPLLSANDTVPFSKFLLWGPFHDHTEHISLSSPLVFKSLLNVNSSTIFPCSSHFTTVLFPHLPDSVYDLLNCNVTLSKFRYEALHIPMWRKRT